MTIAEEIEEIISEPDPEEREDMWEDFRDRHSGYEDIEIEDLLFEGIDPEDYAVVDILNAETIEERRELWEEYELSEDDGYDYRELVLGYGGSQE